MTPTDKKDLETCKKILALYKTISKKNQKNIHDLAGTFPFESSSKVWAMGQLWEEAVEKLENGETQWY